MIDADRVLHIINKELQHRGHDGLKSQQLEVTFNILVEAINEELQEINEQLNFHIRGRN